LMGNPELTVVMGWRLNPIFKEVKEAITKYGELRETLLDKYAEKDEHGKKKIETVILPNGQPSSEFVFLPENRVLFEADLTPLTEETVNLSEPKVKVTELKDDLKLNAVDVDQLLGIVLIPA
ncbi:MAG: hypothetical protein MUP21_02095, partial [Dehalococcoidia bacterium]|nr:hypothetical protein [Dehalococcoidia bacterium]